MKHQESKLQSLMVKWFRYQYKNRIIFAIPNGGHRNILTAKILKGEGVLKGVPDLFIPEPTNIFSGLFIEVKIGKNKKTESQNEMITQLQKRNYRCEVVYSFEDFEIVVNDYFKLGIKL